MRTRRSPSRQSWLLFRFAVQLAVFVPAVVAAADQAYPTRPIDLIVPWGTGGGADYVGRVLAKEMEPVLGVSVPVLNVPGGTGQTGLIKMRDGSADGYTIEEVTSETVLLEVTGHPLFKLSELACLGIVDQQNPGLLVRADSPFKSWEDVVKAAKSRHVSVAFDGFGSSGDLLVNYLNRKLGAKFELVPYDKPGQRIASVLGGHNEMLFTQPGDVVSYIESKQLRPILMFSDARDPAFPDVPASKEFGYAASFIHFRAMYVKAGTPADATSKLTDAVGKAASSQSYEAALKKEAAIPNSVVPVAKASDFINSWLIQGRTISGAR